MWELRFVFSAAHRKKRSWTIASSWNESTGNLKTLTTTGPCYTYIGIRTLTINSWRLISVFVTQVLRIHTEMPSKFSYQLDFISPWFIVRPNSSTSSAPPNETALFQRLNIQTFRSSFFPPHSLPWILTAWWSAVLSSAMSPLPAGAIKPPQCLCFMSYQPSRFFVVFYVWRFPPIPVKRHRTWLYSFCSLKARAHPQDKIYTYRQKT